MIMYSTVDPLGGLIEVRTHLVMGKKEKSSLGKNKQNKQ